MDQLVQKTTCPDKGLKPNSHNWSQMNLKTYDTSQRTYTEVHLQLHTQTHWKILQFKAE